MIRVTDADWGYTLLVSPDQIISVAFNFDRNCTLIKCSDGEAIRVRETVSEVDLLIQQYRRANKGG